MGIKIKGKIIKGLNQGTYFTQIPWVREQFIEKLGIDPYPGTLNLEIVDEDDLKNFKDLKRIMVIEIKPKDPSFCSAKCYPILIHGNFRGAVVIPLIKDYPENKIEIISSFNLKKSLNIREGDFLEIEFI